MLTTTCSTVKVTCEFAFIKVLNYISKYDPHTRYCLSMQVSLATKKLFQTNEPPPPPPPRFWPAPQIKWLYNIKKKQHLFPKIKILQTYEIWLFLSSWTPFRSSSPHQSILCLVAPPPLDYQYYRTVLSVPVPTIYYNVRCCLLPVTCSWSLHQKLSRQFLLA